MVDHQEETVEAEVPEYLRKLRQNDRSIESTILFLDVNDEPFAEATAQALHNNEFVKEVYVIVNIHTRPQRWGDLFNELSTRQNTDHVILIDNTPKNIADRQRIVEISKPIYDAILRNSAVQKISLSIGISGEVLSSYLAAATSLLALNFNTFDIEAAEIPAVAAALGRHNNLRVIYMSCSGATLALMQSFVSKKTKLPCLSFRMNSVSMEQPILPAFLRALCQLKPTHAFFRRIESQAVFLQLTNAIPNLQTATLDIMCEHFNGWNIAEAKREFLAAVKRNFDVRTVRCKSDDATVFLEAADVATLDFYGERNERFAAWVEKPETVPRDLWPLALKLAIEAGKTSLFQSLHSVAPEVASSNRSLKKRKRPSDSE